VGKKSRIPELLRKSISTIFAKPVTAKCPDVKSQISPNYRGQPVFDTQLCIGCGLCCKECPSKAIEMVVVNGKKRPQFSLDKCIFCYRCAEVCCKHAITPSSNYELSTTDKSSLVIKPKPFVEKQKCNSSVKNSS